MVSTGPRVVFLWGDYVAEHKSWYVVWSMSRHKVFNGMYGQHVPTSPPGGPDQPAAVSTARRRALRRDQAAWRLQP